ELAKAGDYDQAAQLAAEIGDAPALVRCALLAAGGELPPGAESLGALAAGELVAARGHHDKAILLFELGKDYRRAAACALPLRHTTQALELLRQVPSSGESARLLERAGQHAEAVAAYLDAGKGEEAVRLARSSPQAARLEAQICLRSGRAVEAGDLFARAGCP